MRADAFCSCAHVRAVTDAAAEVYRTPVVVQLAAKRGKEMPTNKVADSMQRNDIHSS